MPRINLGGAPSEISSPVSIGKMSIGKAAAGTGLGQVLSQMKEQENLIYEMEDRLGKGMGEIDFVKIGLSEVKDKNDDLSLKVVKALEQSAEMKQKLAEILGDAGSMQSFIANTSKDVQSIKRKLVQIEKLHEKLVEDSDVRLTKNEKILLDTEKRSLQTHQAVNAIKFDIAMHKKLKNT
jgi:hypothetical protein